MQTYMATTQAQPQIVVEQVSVPLPPLPAPSARIEELPVPTGKDHSPFDPPLTPDIQSTYVSSHFPTFVQGSSSRPLDAYASPPASSQLSPRVLPIPLSPRALHSPRPSHNVMTPSPLVRSPITYEEHTQSPISQRQALPSPAQTPVTTPAQPPGRRKRRIPPDDQTGDEDLDSDTDASNKRRKNGHDTRCLTIQVSCRFR